jgi:5-methylcytosine-specific restriction protein A
MPLAPKRYCVVPGCITLVEKGRCAPHAVALEHTRRNRDVRKWYYTLQWSELRKAVLVDAAYTCAICGVVQLALEVDHIVKHDGDPGKFWDRTNLQALCAPCHTRKTGRGE